MIVARKSRTGGRAYHLRHGSIGRAKGGLRRVY